MDEEMYSDEEMEMMAHSSEFISFAAIDGMEDLMRDFDSHGDVESRRFMKYMVSKLLVENEKISLENEALKARTAKLLEAFMGAMSIIRENNIEMNVPKIRMQDLNSICESFNTSRS